MSGKRDDKPFSAKHDMSNETSDGSFFTNDFSKEVWENTYKLKSEKSITDTWKRVAKAVASVEKTDELKAEWEAKFYSILKGFKLVPGGRILSNAGTNLGATLVNCFITPKPHEDIDSIDGIMEVLRYQAQTLASEGGYGINFGFIRPRGSYIKGKGIRTPGAVKYMELFDKSSEIITEGAGTYELEYEKTEGKPADEKKKIRKGAQMFLLPIWHPDVEEFIRAKRIQGKLTKANLSVQVTKSFMDKLLGIDPDKTWRLEFPDTTDKHYKKSWDGNLDLWKGVKGLKTKVYKTLTVDYLWDLIMKSTYTFNDPGVVFTDIANNTNCAAYLGDFQYIDTTNPCLRKGTLVDTPKGQVPIEDIKVGDMVNTLHPKGHEVVSEIETHKDADIVRVTFSDGGEQYPTPAHMYYVSDKDKKSTYAPKRVSDMEVGDLVMVKSKSKANSYAKVTSIMPYGKADVYDLYCKSSDTWITDGYVQKGCGEVPLNQGSSCLLSSWNLTAYVKPNKDETDCYFDFDALKRDIAVGHRFMDNVASLTSMPMPIYKDIIEKYRRIGMGILGLGSTLLVLGVKYGSKESVKFIRKLFKVINLEAIKASMDVGVEKGSYFDCDYKKHLENVRRVFLSNLDLSKEELDEFNAYAESKKAFRNASLFSIPPTGNTGCLANNASGGLEPVFSFVTVRTVGVDTVPEHLADKVPHFWEGDFTPNKYFVKKQSRIGGGRDYLEYTDDSGVVYKIIKDRGLCKDVVINDWSVEFLNRYPKIPRDRLDKSQAAQRLGIAEHLAVFEEVSSHLDLAASKTVNVSHDTTYDEFKDIYIKAYKTGKIKGVTTFRDGTREAVMTGVSDNKKDNPDDRPDESADGHAEADEPNVIIKTRAPKRPRRLPCKLHLMTIKGDPWYAIVSLLGEDPYEVFIGRNKVDLFDSNGECVGSKVVFRQAMNNVNAELIKQAKGKYLFKSGEFEHLIIRDQNEPDDVAVITTLSRVMSCGLRHGCDIAYLVEQLEKTAGSFACPTKIFARVLKKYIKDNTPVSGEHCPNCGAPLVRKEGCKTCSSCAWSACG